MCWMLQLDAYLIGFGLKAIASSVGFACRLSPCQRGEWTRCLSLKLWSLRGWP